MFGFLIGRDVSDDAVRVKTLMEMALNKYAKSSKEELRALIARDFESTHYDVSGDSASFVYKEMEDFVFEFDETHPSFGERTLCATGRGRYLGIMIFGDTGRNWYSSVSGGIAYRPTGGARAMARVLHKRFGVKDMSTTLGDL